MLNYNRLAFFNEEAALYFRQKYKKKACRKDLKIYLKINEYILLYSNSSIRSVWLENTNPMLF